MINCRATWKTWDNLICIYCLTVSTTVQLSVVLTVVIDGIHGCHSETRSWPFIATAVSFNRVVQELLFVLATAFNFIQLASAVASFCCTVALLVSGESTFSNDDSFLHLCHFYRQVCWHDCEKVVLLSSKCSDLGPLRETDFHLLSYYWPLLL